MDVSTLKGKRLYLAGPMSNIPKFNLPMFEEITSELRAKGLNVLSPAELDDAAVRAHAWKSHDGDPRGLLRATGVTWGDCLARDVKLIADGVDGIIVMEGWERSRGANLEVYVALTCGLPLFQYKWSPERIEFVVEPLPIAEAMIIINTQMGVRKFGN